MKTLALMFVVVLAAASISISVGMNDSDKDAINATVAQALEKSGNFNYLKAEVDSNNNLSIWSTPKSPDQNSTINNLGLLIGVYLGAASSYSDLSDLNILIGTKDNVTEKMYCKKAWVNEIKTDSAGNMNDNDLITLTLKVLDTHQMTS